MIRVLTIFAIWGLITGATADAVSAQNVARGKHVFRKCLLCHVLDPNATDHLAPPLHNIVGRRAASIKGFAYSSIMRFAGKKGFTWTREAMYYFLDKPEDFMPGTYMAFAGLETQERKDVIAYLEHLTREYKRSVRKKKRTQYLSRKLRKSSRLERFSPNR